jgi:putative transposase
MPAAVIASVVREALNAEWFATSRHAQVVINRWLRQYNHLRPHHALRMRPPVPEAILGKPQVSCLVEGS